MTGLLIFLILKFQSVNFCLTIFSGENGKIIYSLDDESIFTLEQYEDQSGSHLDLIPVGVIDREKFKSAELKMTASNPSIPDQMDQSTTVTIHVTVLDENEFKPTFTKQVSLRKLWWIEFVILRKNDFSQILKMGIILNDNWQ